MPEKRCFKCLEVKPIDEFYKHSMMADGHLNKCKSCAKRDVRENRAAKAEQYSDYDARRFQDPERKKQVRENSRRHRHKHPEKASARRKVTYHVRVGNIARLPCEKCGSDDAEAHHEDYSKPLDVHWMCFRCHREEHGQTVIRADWRRRKRETAA